MSILVSPLNTPREAELLRKNHSSQRQLCRAISLPCGRGENLVRSQSRGFVLENLEDLVEPRDLENIADTHLEPEEPELPPVAEHALEGFDQHREPGAVHVGYA